MNNTVEKWLLWIFQGTVATVYRRGIQAADVKFSQDLAHHKSLKLVDFWQSYLKNKKVDVFWYTV